MNRDLWLNQIEQLLEAIFQRDEFSTRTLAKSDQPFRHPIEIAAMQLLSECDTAACSWLKQLGFKIPKE
jgi:hypothetical protein